MSRLVNIASGAAITAAFMVAVNIYIGNERISSVTRPDITYKVSDESDESVVASMYAKTTTLKPLKNGDGDVKNEDIETKYNALLAGDLAHSIDFLLMLRAYPTPIEFMESKLLSASFSERVKLIPILSLEHEKFSLDIIKRLFNTGDYLAIDVALEVASNRLDEGMSSELEALLLQQSYQVFSSSQLADIARLLNQSSTHAFQVEAIAQRMETLLFSQDTDVQVQAIAGVALYGSQSSLVSAIEQHLYTSNTSVRLAAIKAMFSLERQWLQSHLIEEMKRVASDPYQEYAVRTLATDVLSFHEYDD